MTSNDACYSSLPKSSSVMQSKFMMDKQKKVPTLAVFKEFHSDLATDRISTRDDESDFEFDK